LNAPVVGVFDSGIGGLSLLRALRSALPGARFDYLADNAWAPYGERAAEALRERVLALVRSWQAQGAPDMLVLACNTATAVAIDALRQAHPGLPIVGIEPALRPALRLTRSGQVGVLATRATLHSARYQALRLACLDAAAAHACVHERAADGLADAIERGDDGAIDALCRAHLNALLADAPGIDTLVLGCTHYPLAASAWQAVAGSALQLVDPAEAVARRARDLLPAGAQPGPAQLTWQCTGDPAPLTHAARRWLALDARVLRPAFAG
jgi:glutamate racemase